MKKQIMLMVLVSIVIGSLAIAQSKKSSKQTKPLVTFVELGSVNCIPCKAMQPVMRAIENSYGEQVKVIFYDVWKDDQRHYAETYGIRVIPTQVFLDSNGKELMRHEGFFPQKDIDAFLQSKGLKPKPVEKG